MTRRGLGRAVAALVLAAALGACGAAAPPRPTSPAPSAPPAAPQAPDPPASPSPAAAAPPPAPPAAAPGDPGDEEPALPAGFVRLESGPPVGDERRPPVRCGALQVENVLPDMSKGAWEPWVRVFDATGRVVYQAHGRRYDAGGGESLRMSLVADICGDLTGDGVPEIILTERTIGAHCCYTHYVVSLTSPPRRILMWEKGDSGNGLWPAKLGPGPAHQVRSVHLVSPPFDVNAGDPALSYADTPGYPIVFDLVGGAYVARTFAFQDALRAELEEAKRACAAPGCELDPLLAWGMALIVGDWERDHAALVPDADLRTVLDRRAAAMRRTLRAALDR